MLHVVFDKLQSSFELKAADGWRAIEPTHK
jgi:hypothetical protein